MTEPGPAPRWRALEIGPGGLPADQVRPIGRGRGPEQPVVHPPPPRPPPHPDQRRVTTFGPFRAGRGIGSGHSTAPPRDDWPGEQFPSPPRAALGSFDDVPRRPSRRAGLVVLAAVVAVAVVTGLALWSNSARPLGGSADLAAGDCLNSRGGLSVVPVDCGSADVDFQVVARYEDTSNSSRCAAVSSDVVLVTRDSAVLCLNYVAAVGDCLYAGSSGSQVGKVTCRIASGGSTSGLYRVLAVLRNTVNDRNCPQGTVHTLVHPTSPEVLCLGRP